MKETWKEKLKDFFNYIIEKLIVIIFLIPVFWIILGGYYHSFSKHFENDGLKAIYNPSFGIYRSVEFFWHDDFKGVN